MAYNAHIPQATDHKSQSQADILGNFTALNTYVAVDHIALNLADEGKHKKATFPAAVAPGAVGATEVGLYAATLSGNPELYINKTGSQIPFTASGFAGVGGWTYLPSGLLLQWGVGDTNGGDIMFPRPFVVAAPYSLVVTPITALGNVEGGTQIITGSVLFDRFRAYAYNLNSNHVNLPINFIAIGRGV